MKYLQSKFTLPVSSGKLSQEEWETRVGIRRADAVTRVRVYEDRLRKGTLTRDEVRRLEELPPEGAA